MKWKVKLNHLLIFTCAFYTIFSLTLIHPANQTYDKYGSSTYGKLPRHVARVWGLAKINADQPFSATKDHWLFHNRNPGMFKFIAEISMRLGAKSPIPLQIILIILVNLGIIVQTRWLKMLFKHEIFPTMGCLIILCTHFLTFFGSTIHQHPYNYAFFNFCVYFIIRYRDSGLFKYYVYASLSYLFLCQNYYMFWVSTFGMMAGILWHSGRKLWSKEILALGIAPVATFAFLIWNVQYANGGLDKLEKIAKARVIGKIEEGQSQRAMTLDDYIHYPITVGSRIEKYFYIPGLVFIFLAWILRRLRKSNNSQLDYSMFKFIVPSALSWYLLVYEHTDVHQVVGRYSYFLWMIFFAYFFYEILDYMKKNDKYNWKIFFKYNWIFILIYGGYGFGYYNLYHLIINFINIYNA